MQEEGVVASKRLAEELKVIERLKKCSAQLLDYIQKESKQQH